MGIDRLKRVVWRLQELHKKTFSLKELRKAVIYECGTDDRTIDRNIARLKEVGFIHCKQGYTYEFGETQV